MKYAELKEEMHLVKAGIQGDESATLFKKMKEHFELLMVDNSQTESSVI